MGKERLSRQERLEIKKEELLNDLNAISGRIAFGSDEKKQLDKVLHKIECNKKAQERIKRAHERGIDFKDWLYGYGVYRLDDYAEKTEKELTDDDDKFKVSDEAATIRESTEAIHFITALSLSGQLYLMYKALATGTSFPIEGKISIIVSDVIMLNVLLKVYDLCHHSIDNARLIISNVRANNNLKPLSNDINEIIKIREEQIRSLDQGRDDYYAKRKIKR